VHHINTCTDVYIHTHIHAYIHTYTQSALEEVINRYSKLTTHVTFSETHTEETSKNGFPSDIYGVPMDPGTISAYPSLSQISVSDALTSSQKQSAPAESLSGGNIVMEPGTKAGNQDTVDGDREMVDVEPGEMNEPGKDVPGSRKKSIVGRDWKILPPWVSKLYTPCIYVIYVHTCIHTCI
jgi:hypothetical protein